MRTDLQTYSSANGTSILPVFYVPGQAPLIAGSCDTITYSTHREKVQVRSCGRVSPSGVIRGKRTIAGTLIFKVLHGSEIKDMIKQYNSHYNTILADELPPFTIVITIPMVGEGGNSTSQSRQQSPYVIALIGVEIVDQAFSLSIDDTMLEQSFSYIARDIIDIQDSSGALGAGSSGEMSSSEGIYWKLVDTENKRRRRWG